LGQNRIDVCPCAGGGAGKRSGRSEGHCIIGVKLREIDHSPVWGLSGLTKIKG